MHHKATRKSIIKLNQLQHKYFKNIPRENFNVYKHQIIFAVNYIKEIKGIFQSSGLINTTRTSLKNNNKIISEIHKLQIP